MSRKKRREEMRVNGNNKDGAIVWADGRSPANLCNATRRDGTPCRRPPIQGATVCRAHGGAAPQVKRKAQERLLEGVPKMLRMLRELASNEDVPPAVRLAAIRDWLDRAGIDRKIEIEVTSSGFDQMVVGVLAEVSDEMEVANRVDYDRFAVVAGEVVDDYSPPVEDRDRALLPQPATVPTPYRAPVRRK